MSFEKKALVPTRLHNAATSVHSFKIKSHDHKLIFKAKSEV